MHQTLALEKLYHHLFSTPEHDSTSIDHLTHDLVLWLTQHSFAELPDALEYYSLWSFILTTLFSVTRGNFSAIDIDYVDFVPELSWRYQSHNL